ncbi:hypothetical protein [Asticcacaulis tiandongensis]|uniref:hypothetical protein n=1 Tax=Asticcacaulis tiandongensis TaxID=2565365 RepID=UPI001127FF79|nr:hypothetical protein [Asticcacaulis tiandongensis]
MRGNYQGFIASLVAAITLFASHTAQAELTPGEMLRYAESVTWICDDESESDYMENDTLYTITTLNITFKDDNGRFEGSARTTLTGNAKHLWRRLEISGYAFIEKGDPGFIVDHAVETYATPLPEDMPWRYEREAIFWIEPDTGPHPYKLVGKWRAASGIIAYSTCSLD